MAIVQRSDLTQVDARIARLDADLRTLIATSVADLRSQLMTWIVGLWITSALGFAGMVMALWRLG